jgi:methylthioribulose-1-phosphate dehydratase
LDIVTIPIIENSQDMVEFSAWMEKRKTDLTSHCFIIKGHGTYAWGKNLFEAKRHLETIEYLCELEWKLQKTK